MIWEPVHDAAQVPNVVSVLSLAFFANQSALKQTTERIRERIAKAVFIFDEIHALALKSSTPNGTVIKDFLEKTDKMPERKPYQSVFRSFPFA